MTFIINKLNFKYFFDFNIYQLIIMALYGLKKKPTLNDVINDIVTEPNPIKYPDRTATFVRNSFELSQLDGEGMREMEEQQARQMKEAAKEHAIRNLARNSDVSHADLSEQAKAVTRNASIQAMLKPTSSEKGSQNTVNTSDQSAQHSTSTLERGIQKGVETADGSTQHAPQQTSSSSQTVQEFDIGQGDMEIEVIPPHVEDRRVQMLEQENDALRRDKEQEMMIAERRNRLLYVVQQELANSSKRHEEDKDKALREVLQQASNMEMGAAAQLASVESQAERHINQKQQEHNREIAAVKSQEQHTYRKEIEEFEQDAQRQIHHKGKHSTTPTSTPEKNKKSKTDPQGALPMYSHLNPAPALPTPSTGASSSSTPAAAAPKTKAKASPTAGQSSASSSSTAAPKAKVKATRKARSSSPERTPEQEEPTTSRSRSRAKSEDTATRTKQIPPSQIGIQKLREELEHAKNNKKISPDDISTYMKLYDEWKDAKGNPMLKREKLKGLQALYKRTLYKK
jgi:hypothetical protein